MLEAGTGAGAALLCLAARVPDVSGLGVERDPALARLAAANFFANGFAALQAVETEVESLASHDVFDHAIANPPWHPIGTQSPDPQREAARRAHPDLLHRWVGALGARLRRRGTLTVVVPPHMLSAWLAALPAAGCGSPSMYPLWPGAGRPARMLLLRAIRGGAAPLRMLPGLVLHDGPRLSDAAEAVLRRGSAIVL